MSRRPFDCYMVQVGIGTHPKLARLTDSEFRAHIAGVLAVAARSPIRGCLLVGELNAEPTDVARAAGVSPRTAKSAMTKLEALGVLFRDETLGCLRVHDWDDVNPQPKKDATAAERQRRLREARNASRNGGCHAPRNGHVTPPEVEVEVEVGGKPPTPPNSNVESGIVELFAYWQEQCGHPQAKLSSDRRSKIATRLREGYTAEQIRAAIDGAARAAFVNEAGKRFDDIELICRTGSKLESFMERGGNGNGGGRAGKASVARRNALMDHD